MLTLFKPWQSGSDLKESVQNWHEALELHVFSRRQLGLMDNFNLRYECLDECDDFHAQMRKNDGSGLLIPSWDDEIANELGDDYFPSVDAKAKHFDDDVEAALAKQGHTDLLHLQQMKEMRDILRGAHWTH